MNQLLAAQKLISSPKKAFELAAKYKPIEVPHHVWRIIGSQTIELAGEQICLNTQDGDYAPLDEARAAVEFYVDQLGGKIKWDNL